MKPTVQKILTKLAKKKENNIEVNLEKVELGIAQDLISSVKSYQETLKTTTKVIDASIKVNTAIKKVENEARFYNKYKGLVYDDLGRNIKNILSLMQKAEAAAKELGIEEEEIKGYKEASNFVIDSKRALKILNGNPLLFDI